MNLLLITHTLIWFVEGNAQLPIQMRRIIEDGENLKYVSIVSFWEIAIKDGNGKLSMSMDIQELYHRIVEWDAIILDVTLPQILTVRDMPMHHRDPFDRMILAQAQMLGLSVISRDGHFGAYGVPILW